MTNRAIDPQINILLIDDYPFFRSSVSRILNWENDLKVCAETEDRESSLAALKSDLPDVILLNMALRNGQGYRIFEDIRTTYPETPVIVMCVFGGFSCATRAIAQGARGYIKESITGTWIADAIRFVLAGGLWFDEEYAFAEAGNSNNTADHFPNIESQLDTNGHIRIDI